MAVRGIGVDLASISRVRSTVANFGIKFLVKAFHPEEIARYNVLAAASSGPLQHKAASYLTSRWAAKEALHKALRSERLLFPEIQIVSASASPVHSAATTAQMSQQSNVADEARSMFNNTEPVGDVQRLRVGAAPSFVFHGTAASIIRAHNVEPLLSISHDGDYAVAFVTLVDVIKEQQRMS
jgi:phosphopantetheine--protein transferase-like protein